MIPRTRVRGWGAWAPGVGDDADAWRGFLAAPEPPVSDEAPKLPAVEPLLRRRMSRLSRMAAAAAFEACRAAGVPPSVPRVVLGSRHGELGTLAGLLRDLSMGDALSPMAFTASVHHTAGGFFGIAARNAAPARAVAAGEATFPCAFLDAAGFLSDDPSLPVLLIAADDLVPAPFDALAPGEVFPHGVAFLLEAEDGLSFSAGPARGVPPRGLPAALGFLKWFLSEDKMFSLDAGGRNWSWTR